MQCSDVPLGELYPGGIVYITMDSRFPIVLYINETVYSEEGEEEVFEIREVCR